MYVKTIENTAIECIGVGGLIFLSPVEDELLSEDERTKRCAIEVKLNPECSTKFFHSQSGACLCEKVNHNCKRIYSPTMAQYRLINSK